MPFWPGWSFAGYRKKRTFCPANETESVVRDMRAFLQSSSVLLAAVQPGGGAVGLNTFVYAHF